MEHYHRTMKVDCIGPGTPLCLDDARRIVQKFVTQYNAVRLYSAIEYLTPADKLARAGRDDPGGP
ncbi:MAG: integrase core domain-containing protein [Planctomycetota bacterium]|nr:integrase core domain-containing protein [Planctomycetota bacterium]